MSESTNCNYEDLYNKQKAFFESGITRSYQFRKEQLLKLKETIKSNEKLISEALYKDLHKPELESYGTEIGFVYEEINFTLKHLKKWMKPERVSSPLVVQPASSKIYRDPLGVILIIAPWNYPFQLMISPLVGAIAGGNCAILKPSEETYHTALIIEKIIKEVFPPEYIAVIQGAGAIIVPELMDKISFGHVFFTGSVPVGKIIMAAAAKHLTPITLELGGKSPCIVDETANLSIAAKRIVWGKFINAGQTCVAPDYLIVHESVKEEFILLIISAIEKFYGEDPSQSADYPRMVNIKRFNAVARFLTNGKILYGGKFNFENKYISPTIIDGVSTKDPIMQEEIFGPILPILSYQNVKEIPQIISANPNPLALYLFTTSLKTEEYILKAISFGGGCINDVAVHLGNPSIPFGGVGSSGIGSYHGKFSFDTFTHAKGVLKGSSKIDIPFRYPPYKNNLKYFKMVMR